VGQKTRPDPEFAEFDPGKKQDLTLNSLLNSLNSAEFDPEFAPEFGDPEFGLWLIQRAP